MNIKRMGIFLSLLLLCFNLSATTQNDRVIRAAIDIGMGGPKLQVAEIDTKTNKIVKMLHTQRYFVNFYDSISKNANNHLSSEVMAEGRKAFKDAIDTAHSFDTDGIVAIATASFRSAANGEQFADEIQNETGVKVHIVDQNLEGKLAFQAILSKTDINPENLVVWDVGGGSIQFVAMAPDGSCLVDCGKEGVGVFTDYIIESIQHRNIEKFASPNPMSAEDINQATSYARNLSKKVEGVFKEKITHPTTSIVGAGSVFGYGIAKMLNRNSFTIEDLAVVIEDLAGKTDADLGGGDYAFCEGTNAILVLGFMQTLNIQQMQIINVNNADGALIYESFWQ
jgi:exopolyphosphatase / guanosine-5'-triphosphate,3'-diphosphate pyrophosphatase